MGLSLCTPSSALLGYCIKEIRVPWNEFLAVVALGLWSKLLTAAVVNNYTALKHWQADNFLNTKALANTVSHFC